MPPIPIDSLPATPWDGGARLVEDVEVVDLGDLPVELLAVQRGRVELAPLVAEILRRQLPAAAGRHAVAEGPLAGGHQHRRRGRRRAGSRPRGSRPAWRWRGGPRWRDPPAGRPPPAKAFWIAAVGPWIDGVMMWSASELTPTATGSIPSGLKPFSPHVVEVAQDPEHRAAGDVGAAQAGERLRDRGVGRDHPRASRRRPPTARAAADRSPPSPPPWPRRGGWRPSPASGRRRRSSRRRPARRRGR